jgi:hypothetical protein
LILHLQVPSSSADRCPLRQPSIIQKLPTLLRSTSTLLLKSILLQMQSRHHQPMIGCTPVLQWPPIKIGAPETLQSSKLALKSSLHHNSLRSSLQFLQSLTGAASSSGSMLQKFSMNKSETPDWSSGYQFCFLNWKRLSEELVHSNSEAVAPTGAY